MRIHCKKRAFRQPGASRIGDHSNLIAVAGLFCGPVAFPLLFLETSHEYTATLHHLHPDRRSATPGHCVFPAHRSQLCGPGGYQRDRERHLGRSTGAGGVSGVPEGRTARAQHAGRTGQEDPAARCQHHQAAQHLCFGVPAQGGHCRAAVQGLCAARLPRPAQGRQREGNQGPLRQVHRLCREPRAA